MLDPKLSHLAVTAVVLLIAVLAYPSQIYLLSPHWTRNQHIFFNAAVACIWITYARAIFTDPGSPPAEWVPPVVADAEDGRGRAEQRRLVATHARWCKRCERYKPARTHHCKTCGRCILKMDHHCPWTASCIGYRNTPHFLRFLFFATSTTFYLLLALLARAYAVWVARDLPAYYSPHSTGQLLLLAVLLLVALPLWVALLALSLRTLQQTATGYTTIETWQDSRLSADVRRGNARKQVYPYDVGIWENLVAAFGYQFFLPLWLNPFARSPRVGARVAVPGVRGGLVAGLEWEVNGFESPDLVWPPKDPDTQQHALERSGVVSILQDPGELDVGAFRRRQAYDLKRWERGPVKAPPVRIPNHGIMSIESLAPIGDSILVGEQEEEEGDGWRNEDGERLADYGVDEEVEEDDEDVPLAVLVHRKRMEVERVGGVLGERGVNTLY